MDDLILNHTMFPQYARFLTAEKRKVALGCVLAQNPDLLVLDEPIASLDAKTQSWLTQFLIALKTSGKTMIIATHDRDFAERIADEIITITDEHKIG